MGERAKPTPGPVAAELERIKELFRHHDGDAEDLISYARGITRLRSDLTAALSRAEKAEGERDRMREALSPFAEFAGHTVDEHGWIAPPGRIFDWFGPSDFRRARAALSTGEPTPRVEPVTKRL